MNLCWSVEYQRQWNWNIISNLIWNINFVQDPVQISSLSVPGPAPDCAMTHSDWGLFLLYLVTKWSWQLLSQVYILTPHRRQTHSTPGNQEPGEEFSIFRIIRGFAEFQAHNQLTHNFLLRWDTKKEDPKLFPGGRETNNQGPKDSQLCLCRDLSHK